MVCKKLEMIKEGSRDEDDEDDEPMGCEGKTHRGFQFRMRRSFRIKRKSKRQERLLQHAAPMLDCTNKVEAQMVIEGILGTEDCEEHSNLALISDRLQFCNEEQEDLKEKVDNLEERIEKLGKSKILPTESLRIVKGNSSSTKIELVNTGVQVSKEVKDSATEPILEMANIARMEGLKEKEELKERSERKGK
ncbi:hypothetical protein BGX38DRAFT_1332649 [Terfezia claveryi]|nr:hypothetical protein BGX38DRAFT_1332649 [Terfezia claveryi]